MHIECQPTIEMGMRVDMGGGSSESNAEAWAVGERHGVPVDENDQTYHNNAKWYAENGLIVPVFTDNMGTITCDTSFADLLQAIQETRCVSCILVVNSTKTAYQLVTASSVSIIFGYTVTNSHTGAVFNYSIQYFQNGQILSDSDVVSLNDVIDDNAGTGDTGNTWSADKLTSELDLKAPKANPVFTGSISMGRKSGTTVGTNSTAFGDSVQATADNAHAEGGGARATAIYAHAEGGGTLASGAGSHAEGQGAAASGDCSHAEGGGTVAIGRNSHAEGNDTVANNLSAHAEGGRTLASGTQSHAEGIGTTASGAQAHAEGGGTQATGDNAHAEGGGTQATGSQSHAEGTGTQATGQGSHAEGGSTVASGNASHAEGGGTIANGPAMHAEGQYNVPATNNEWAHVVGNGTSDSIRSNAYALDWDGTGHFAGDVYVNCNNDSTGGNKVAVIDDTAGAGDTNKTFSADKLTTMDSELKNAINDKADEPTGTKSAGKVYGLNSSLEPVWVDQQTTAEIETAVDNWLEENITNPDSPPLDRSLSSSAAAAPADLVGELTSTAIPVPSVVTGKYVNQKGADNTSSSFSETDYIPYIYNIGGIITLNCTIYNNVSIAFYDANKIPVRIISGSNASDYGITPDNSLQRLSFEVPTGTAYFRASYKGTATTSSFNIITGYQGIDASLQNTLYSMMAANESAQIAYTGTNKKQLAKGIVVDSSDTTYYVTNDIAIEPSTYYILSASAGYGASYFAILDGNKNVIIYSSSPSGSGTAIINRVVFTPPNAAYIRIAYITSRCNARLNKITDICANTKNTYGWTNKFLSISYSYLDVAVINTLETYISAGHFGFNACKGDVEVTSDGKLIMCHDPGFTFDGNGRIITYDPSNSTPIVNLTYNQCMSYEYAGRAGASDNNHYQKVCDIDQYLDVCKQYGMIAFITVRSTSVDALVAELFAALKRHVMMDHCIINSYEFATLEKIRIKNKDIPMSFIMPNNDEVPIKRIYTAKQLGNIALTLVSDSEDMRTYISDISASIENAHENGIGLMFSQPHTMEDVTWLRNRGFCGAQIGRPVLPYIFEQVRFKVSIANGTASLSEWNNLNTMEATVSQVGNVISVSEFTIAGSERGFPDLIMDVWMNKFPYRITATSENGNSVTASWQNNALKLTVSDISVNDTIDVMIEV